MKFSSFHRSAALPLLLCSLVTAPLVLSAQEDGISGPPKILVVQREYLKPGKAGSLHTKSESAFVQAMTAAKSTSHYFGMESMSGPSRALYFSAYPSLAAWEQDNKSIRKNATLAAALDRATVADGELLSEYDQNVMALREDLSLNNGDLIGMRYMDITRLEILPGHDRDWESLAKLYVDGYKKAVPNARWTTFELVYGVADTAVYIVVSPLKSLADADSNMGDSKKFVDSMGAAGMKKLAELAAACIKTQANNLYEISPRMSYPPDSWIKAEPDFWRPKVAAPAMKPATKPAPTN